MELTTNDADAQFPIAQGGEGTPEFMMNTSNIPDDQDFAQQVAQQAAEQAAQQVAQQVFMEVEQEQQSARYVTRLNKLKRVVHALVQLDVNNFARTYNVGHSDILDDSGETVERMFIRSYFIEYVSGRKDAPPALESLVLGQDAEKVAAYPVCIAGHEQQCKSTGALYFVYSVPGADIKAVLCSAAHHPIDAFREEDYDDLSKTDEIRRLCRLTMLRGVKQLVIKFMTDSVLA